MRAKSWVLVVLAVVSMPLAGCATTQSVAREDKVLELPRGRLVLRVDQEYVARVEALARKNGTRVHWINPPLRRVESE